MKLSYVYCILILLNLLKIAKLSISDVFVLQNFVKCTLLPSILYAPIQFGLSTLFQFFFVSGTIAIVSILSELALRLFKVFPCASTPTGLSDSEFSDLLMD